MRYFIRLLIALLTFTTGLTAVAIFSGLRQPALSSIPSQPDEDVSVAISPVEFFGWWQDQQSAARRHMEGDLLPSHTYRQFETWVAADESQSEQIDIVCRLENRGRRAVDLMVLAVGEFSILPDGRLAGSDESLRDPTILTERHNLGQQVIRGLAPLETREVTFTSSNLKAIVEKYLRKEFGTLRPSELRVNIDVRTLDKKQVGQQQGRLRLILGH